QSFREFESAMVITSLSFDRSVAVETVHAFLGVAAHLVFVNDGRGFAGVAFGALAAGADVCRRRLLYFGARSPAVDDECRCDERCRDDDGDEDGRERAHAFLPLLKYASGHEANFVSAVCPCI